METAILFLLARGRMHRYGLYKALIDAGAKLNDVRIVYRRVHRLAASGLVLPRWETGRERQPLKTYGMTARGRSELRSRLAAAGGERRFLASLRRIGRA